MAPSQRGVLCTRAQLRRPRHPCRARIEVTGAPTIEARRPWGAKPVASGDNRRLSARRPADELSLLARPAQAPAQRWRVAACPATRRKRAAIGLGTARLAHAGAAPLAPCSAC